MVKVELRKKIADYKGRKRALGTTVLVRSQIEVLKKKILILLMIKFKFPDLNGIMVSLQELLQEYHALAYTDFKLIPPGARNYIKFDAICGEMKFRNFGYFQI